MTSYSVDVLVDLSGKSITLIGQHSTTDFLLEFTGFIITGLSTGLAKTY